MKILNFGSCNIDYVYSVDHIVTPGETETAGRLDIFPGGKGLNQSIALAKAGAEVYHAGCIGTDGKLLTDILSESNVNISYIKYVNSPNGHAIIQVNASGENSIFIYPGSNDMVSPEYIDSVLKDFDAGDILLLQNEISNIDYIIEKAYQKKMCIILNPSPFNEKITDLDFNMLSYIIINEVEAKEISGFSSPHESMAALKTRYPNLKIMLTLGSKGCILSDGDKEFPQPAYLVQAVDTTAAGDTFTGYFVAGIADGVDCREVLKLASAASAISVTRMGAAPSIPDKSEVLKSIRHLKPNNNSSRDDSIRNQIEEYIMQNIKTANLGELSEKLGYSTVYTGTLVKKMTGESFSKLLKSKRCSFAAEMLTTSQLSVGEIISVIGYENESFFRKAFKEQYGKNPLEYRKSK